MEQIEANQLIGRYTRIIFKLRVFKEGLGISNGYLGFLKQQQYITGPSQKKIRQWEELHSISTRHISFTGM